MFGFTRLIVLMAIIVISGIFAGITVGIAQTPKGDPATKAHPTPKTDLSPNFDEIPKANPTPLADPDETILGKFREAFNGDKPVTPTGDAIFDGFQDFAKRQGSVLDGSSLDLSLSETESQESSDSQRALAAELLLRTSRTLEQIGPVDETRQQLVKKMRGEAIRLLSQ